MPVFACAAAKAALLHLRQEAGFPSVTLDLVNPPEAAEITIEQVATLSPNSALAITRSDPGDNLDLTRHTPIWAVVEVGIRQAEAGAVGQPTIQIKGGEGIGWQIDNPDQPAIYTYARQLLEENLAPLLRSTETLQVTIILPEGRSLAERTSNAAFGIVEGLSLLGTSGIAQPLSAPGQLEIYRQVLQEKRQDYDALVFCIGENGLNLAEQLGIQPDRLVKTANWLGSMLVEAGLQEIQSLLLFGYHGKLIKLAGGIFHTHHHVADGRQEILAAHAANLGLPTAAVQTLLNCPTTEAALYFLQELDATTGSHWVQLIYGAIAQKIDQRAETYIRTHSNRPVNVGCVLFDRQRRIIVQSLAGASIFSQVC